MPKKRLFCLLLTFFFVFTVFMNATPSTFATGNSVIPAKPAGTPNLVSGAPTISANDMASIFAYNNGTLSIVGQPGIEFNAEFDLDSSLTSSSAYVITVDYNMPANARYSDDHGPIVVFRKDNAGKYLGLWMQGMYCYLRTYTLNAETNTFTPAGGDWRQVSLLPDGSQGTLKLYTTSDGVWVEVYDQSGNLQEINGNATSVFWNINGGEPAFALSTNGSKATFSNIAVYDPSYQLISVIPVKPSGAPNLVLSAPTISAKDMANVFAFNNGELNIIGQPSTVFNAEFALDPSLTASSEYVISVDYNMPADARYSGDHGPIVIFRKDNEGKYLGLWMQGVYCYLRTYTLDTATNTFTAGGGDWRQVSLLPDGSQGTLKLYTTANGVWVEVYDQNGNLQTISGKSTSVVWGINGGEPAFALSTCGSQATFSNMTVYDPNYTDIANTNAFVGASLTLQNNLKLKFYVTKALVDALDGTPTVNFSTSSFNADVTENTVEDGYYVYSFANIGPDRMGVEVTATLTGTYNGGTAYSSSITYSAKDYCKDVLDKTDTDDGNPFFALEAGKKAALQQLLADLLNYGAASQTYAGYDTGNLVNAVMSDTQKGYATSADPTLNATRSLTGSTDSVIWKSVMLNLKDTVGIKYTFDTQGNPVTSVKITDTESGELIATIDSANFTDAGNGQKVVLFNGLKAVEMRKSVSATVYNGDEVVSRTLNYSIAAYATQKKDQGNTLSDLMIAMIKYGDSAINYKTVFALS